MAISASTVTAEIYRLLGESIDPLERRKQIEQLIHDALHGTMRSFESRIAALEEVAHTPFDFTDLIKRLEAVERRSAPLMTFGEISSHAETTAVRPQSSGQVSTWMKDGVLVDRHGKPVERERGTGLQEESPRG